MRAITELERRISALEIPELGHSTVSEHADAHVLDSSTLAVVIVCGHNIRLIERAIRAHTTDTAEVQIERDIITITL
ncbi:hypothetical protein JK358_37110 [Nocardia sp. 2]|uniref:DUF503 domain-containing protein n=1 Tax=Nocardia acididurans TaxID=2802282 RepID=A0ABS1MID4_9NOCA|nr:hypothetical protein [Nocardia acididurans]MBL1080031.1 hypothetical protein [Nocardia acididurans]